VVRGINASQRRTAEPYACRTFQKRGALEWREIARLNDLIRAGHQLTTQMPAFGGAKTSARRASSAFAPFDQAPPRSVESPVTRRPTIHTSNHRLRRYLNALTLILVCVVVILGLKRYGPPRQTPLSTPKQNVLVLTGLASHPESQTMILVLSTHCGQCSLMVGFYKELLAAAQGRGMRTAALFPEEVSDAGTYLRDLGIATTDVKQMKGAELTSLTVPSIIVVNSAGAVTHSWQGELLPAVQTDVFAELGLAPPAAEFGEGVQISSQQLPSLAAKHPELVVIDSRPREEFRRGHITNAINLPDDELAARLPIEAPPPNGTVVVLYCFHCGKCETSNPTTGDVVRPIGCTRSIRVLKRFGYSQNYLLEEDLSTVGKAGISITGKIDTLPSQQLLWNKHYRAALQPEK